MQLTITGSGELDLARSWQRYVRPELWSTWSPQISRVDCDDEEIVTGSHGRVHSRLGVAVDFDVTAVDRLTYSWSWRVQAPLGVRVSLQHSLFRAGRGTRTTLELDGPAPVLLGYAPVAKLALHRLLRV